MRNLRSEWKSFLRFCQEFQLVPLPTSSSTISCFLVYLSQHTLSYRYILNHLNSLHVVHLYYDLPCDTLTCFSVRLMTMGLKCLLGTHTNQKHPVTLEMFIFITCWTHPSHHSLHYGACFWLPSSRFYGNQI